MAHASPEVTTYAFDLASSARELCGKVAELNAVGQRVQVRKRFSTKSLDQISPGAALVLCDIEGAEGGLFTANLVARLAGSTVVIEVHEDARPGTSERLRGAFSHSHSIEIVGQRSNNGDESRPPLMHWLIARPKEH